MGTFSEQDRGDSDERHQQPSDHSGTDLAVLAVALELSHEADAERSTAGAAASTPQDLATPRAGEHTDGIAEGQTQHKHADATSSRAAELPAPTGRLVSEPPPAATAGHAAGTAARSYPIGLQQVPSGHVQQTAGHAATPDAGTATSVAARTRR